MSYMRWRSSSLLNRTLCDVLEEMRKFNETRNYSSLAGLIEEAQSMANRMESALSDKKDVEGIREEYKRLVKEVKKLEKKKEKLEK